MKLVARLLMILMAVHLTACSGGSGGTSVKAPTVYQNELQGSFTANEPDGSGTGVFSVQTVTVQFSISYNEASDGSVAGKYTDSYQGTDGLSHQLFGDASVSGTLASLSVLLPVETEGVKMIAMTGTVSGGTLSGSIVAKDTSGASIGASVPFTATVPVAPPTATPSPTPSGSGDAQFTAGSWGWCYSYAGQSSLFKFSFSSADSTIHYLNQFSGSTTDCSSPDYSDEYSFTPTFSNVTTSSFTMNLALVAVTHTDSAQHFADVDNGSGGYCGQTNWTVGVSQDVTSCGSWGALAGVNFSMALTGSTATITATNATGATTGMNYLANGSIFTKQ